MSGLEVVEQHLIFVRAQNSEGMAANYSQNAVLRRPGAKFVGQHQIAGYFGTVADRLGKGAVAFEDPAEQTDGTIVVRWSIEGGPSSGTQGVDTYVVQGGMIVEQTVVLLGSDF